MCEEWKEFENGRYAVSSHGRVRKIRDPQGNPSERLLVQSTSRQGYRFIRTTVPQKAKAIFVAALVAEHFIGPRPEGKQVNHKDGVKTNNRVANLEYLTRLENVHHGRRSGLHPPLRFTEEIVQKARELRGEGKTYQEIADTLGMTKSYAWRIVKNNRRTIDWGKAAE